MGDLRILIIEKSDILLYSLESSLSKIGGVSIYEAAELSQALECVNEKETDLIIADLDVIDKFGFYKLNDVIADKMIPVIIIVSSNTDEECYSHMKNVFAYIMKPFGETELMLSINIAWNRYKDYIESKAALENRKIIERAKGVLMDEFGLKEREAMIRLQKLSKDRNKKLVYVAKDIINARQMMIS